MKISFIFYHKFRIMLITCLVLYISFSMEHIGVSAYGQRCDSSKLNECKENEMCSIANNGSAYCVCLPGFDEMPIYQICSEPSHDRSTGGSGWVTGFSVLFVVVFIAVISYLQYRYRILSPVVRKFHQWRNSRHGVQVFEVTDDFADVNPIV